MKKTHKAVLKILENNMQTFYQVKSGLHRVFPDMRMGLNSYNVSLLLGSLLRLGYVRSKFGLEKKLYCLTEKGRKYVWRMREGEVKNDS